MRLVTKYAMLALMATSFVALNNCGHQSESTIEPVVEHDENGPASDFALVGAGPTAAGPIGYPALAVGAPWVTAEVNCNNGVDDDGDGLVDCMDNDCQVHPECSEFGPPLEEIINSRSLTVYPNGLIVPEDVAFLKARGADDDDAHGWQRDNFFATKQKDCWIDPKYMDPYYNIPLGEALVAGPEGPVGPLLFPDQAFAFIGPRAGLINECEFGTDLLFHHMDDDNNAGAGAGGDQPGPDDDDDT